MGCKKEVLQASLEPDVDKLVALERFQEDVAKGGGGGGGGGAGGGAAGAAALDIDLDEEEM